MEDESLFPVHFGNPRSWAGVGSQPLNVWKLTGAGQIGFQRDRVYLRGRPRLLFRWAPPKQVELSARAFSSVWRVGNCVVCQVELPGGRQSQLELWAADESVAARIERRLPAQAGAEFLQSSREAAQFEEALKGVGTYSAVAPAYVTLCVLAFLATAFAGGGVAIPDGWAYVQWGSNFGPRTTAGEWWRLYTSMFLHFGLLHLLLNMWVLWSVGGLAERLFGSAHFFLLYVLSGLSGSVASLLWNPGVNSAGASGAIFGVIGGLLAFMLNPGTQVPPSVALSHRNAALAFVAFNVVNGLIHPNIDNAAHIGGLLGGIVLGWLLARPLERESREEPVPRLGVAAIVGITMVFAGCWELSQPRPEEAVRRQFAVEMQLFADEERRIDERLDALDRLKERGRITPHEWGVRVIRDVLPRWDQLQQQLEARELPDNAKWQVVRPQLVELALLRRFALELGAEAARDGDAEKLEWASKVQRSGEQKAQEIKAIAW